MSPPGGTSAWPVLDGDQRTVLQQQVYLGRQDAIELATLVRSGGPEGIAKFLVGLDSRRKDAVLVALASAVDVERTARQWWAWLDGPDFAGPPVRSVPRAAEVARFARAHDLSADQVWRAIVALHAAAAPAVVRPDSP